MEWKIGNTNKPEKTLKDLAVERLMKMISNDIDSLMKNIKWRPGK